MMQQYTSLAAYYDRLTQDVPYEGFARRIGALLQKSSIPVHLLLELGCGTGTLSHLLSQQGYEMICCDNSPEMLDVARKRCQDLAVPPVFICQDMANLDLYGTVQAAVCCLDSVNYLTGLRELKRAFYWIGLFMEAGGLFIFDVKTPQLFQQMAGTVSVYEEEDLYGVWQYGYDPKSHIGQHQVDLFCLQPDHTYQRQSEWHWQRAYTAEQLTQALEQAGFRVKGRYQGLSTRRMQAEEGRILWVAEKQR